MLGPFTAALLALHFGIMLTLTGDLAKELHDTEWSKILSCIGPDSAVTVWLAVLPPLVQALVFRRRGRYDGNNKP